MSASRSKLRHEEEEHENHERWLVTYADMLTVLMALFIVMFAMSVVDKNKFEQLKAGLDEYFGNGPTLMDGGTGLMAEPQKPDNPEPVSQDVEAALAALHNEHTRADAMAAERDDLEEARKQILDALTEKGLQDSVRFRIDERGLVVTIVTDEVLFGLGSATLQSRGRTVLDAVAPAVRNLPNPLTVEGHTDNLPIRGGRFPSNWELSTERATTVLRYLIETHAVPPKRLSAAGYADQRPIAGNTPAGRSTNRRVEVIVRATAATMPAPPVRPAGATEPAPVELKTDPEKPTDTDEDH
jgi:chemotaxis protein MotB